MKTLTIKTFAVLLTAFAALTTLNSCQKEKATPPGSTTAKTAPTVNNFTMTNQMVIDGMTAYMSSSKGSFKTKSLSQAFGSCGTVTVDSSKSPAVKTWDFGSGCTGSDGHFRSGQIVVTYNSTNPRIAGDTATLSFNNYVIDTIQASGGLSITTYLDSSNYINFALAMNVSLVVDGITYPENGNLNYQWSQGINNNPAQNIQFTVTGSINGTDKNMNNQAATITTPLLKNFATPGCNYYVKGNVTVVTNNSLTETLDYGDGSSCAGTYTSTSAGKTTTLQQ